MRLLFLIIFLASCKNPTVIEKKDQPKDARQEINKVLFAQQESWNSGDIDGFMNGYWNSEKLCFIGSKGLTKGWNETLENYKKGYPDLATMGQLTFEVIELNKLSDLNYLMIGKYTLKRVSDEPSGYFSLNWKYIEGDWLIVADHTSG